ncbi:hypothetical protein STENM36S_04594 [Streptomyces tendae]
MTSGASPVPGVSVQERRARGSSTGEEGEGVGVHHGEHRVQVHQRPGLGQLDRDHPPCRARPEQPPRQDLHTGRSGALAEADQDRAVAYHLDVAALDGGRRHGLAVDPAVRAGLGEHRVVGVHRLVVDGLGLAPGLGHRVHRDPVVDPAAAVPGEQGVGQGRQDEVVVRQEVQAQGAQRRVPLAQRRRQFPLVQAAEQVGGQFVRAHGGQYRPGRGGQAGTEVGLPVVQDAGEEEVHRLVELDRLGEQVVQEMDGDAPLPQECLEGPVLLLGAGHPHDVVEDSSSLLAGVSRSKSRPGSCRTTCFSAPTSEFTWNMFSPDPEPGQWLLGQQCCRRFFPFRYRILFGQCDGDFRTRSFSPDQRTADRRRNARGRFFRSRIDNDPKSPATSFLGTAKPRLTP